LFCVHRVLDRDVTFWRYAPQSEDPPPSSAEVAAALLVLHQALRQCDPPRRAVTDDLQAAVELLNDDVFAAELPTDDRQLLQSAVTTPLDLSTVPDVVVHGSPHRSGISLTSSPPL
jgi:hypothetical protein